MRKRKNSKFIVLTILILCIATMSSAYAIWNKSVDVEATLSNAVIRVDYVGRIPSSSNIHCASQPSNSNPLLSIHETGDISITKFDNIHTITYTLKNNGTVDVYIYGIDVDPSLTYYKSKNKFDKRVYIDYTIDFPSGYSITETSRLKEATDGVTFTSSSSPDSRCLLAVGDTCTLEVVYYLNGTMGRRQLVEITSKIDTPLYVVAR